MKQKSHHGDCLEWWGHKPLLLSCWQDGSSGPLSQKDIGTNPHYSIVICILNVIEIWHCGDSPKLGLINWWKPIAGCCYGQLKQVENTNSNAEHAHECKKEKADIATLQWHHMSIIISEIVNNLPICPTICSSNANDTIYMKLLNP